MRLTFRHGATRALACLRMAPFLLLPLAVVSCGGGGDDAIALPAASTSGNNNGGVPPGGTVTYAVSVKVTGLGSPDLVLQNNAGDDLAVSGNGTVSFHTPLASGAGYGVTVKSQPSAAQVCVAHDAFGTVGSSPVSSVEVRCTQTGAARFAYVPNESANSASVFSVDGNGLLSAGTDVSTGVTPEHMAVDAAGRFAYVANANSNTVTVFQIDPTTGALLNGTDTPGVSNPRYIALDPQGRFAFVVGSTGITRFPVDAVTGLLGTGATFGSPSTSDRAMAVDDAGRFAYVPHMSGSIDVMAIDQVSGALSAPVQSLTLPGGVSGSNVALDPSGRFAYVAGGSTPTGKLIAYAIDPQAGTLTQIASVGTGSLGRGLAIDPAGRFVYVANVNDRTVSMFSIDARTGVPAPLPGIAVSTTGTAPTAISVDRTGRFAYTANQVSDSVSRFTIDAVTGVLSNEVVVGTGRSPQFVALTK